MNNQYSELEQNYSNKDNDYYDMSRSELVDFIPAKAKSVLDIGCGSGNFGEIIKRARDCRVWGIEPSPQIAQKAAEKIDKVINTTFSTDIPELQNERFDAICFNDVLEHLINPEEILIQCKKFLAPDGCVVASIPNILFFPVMKDILIKQDWKYENSGTLDNTHLRFFTKKSIARMFEKCGYEITKIEGIKAVTGRKYKMINALFLNRLKDWKFMQFAIQAKLKPIKN